MPFNFESFDRRDIPATTRPMATLQRGGLLSLNQASYMGIGEPEAVELLYDKEARVIALRAIDIAERKAYPIRKIGAGQSYIVSLTKLCTHYGIETAQSLRYEATVEDGTLIVELNTPIGVVTGPRSKPRTDDAARLIV